MLRSYFPTMLSWKTELLFNKRGFSRMPCKQKVGEVALIHGASGKQVKRNARWNVYRREGGMKTQHQLCTCLVNFLYLATWFPASYGPLETSPQSTPGLAADGDRWGPPLIPGEESPCSARCWSPGPTAVSSHLRCRTGQPCCRAISQGPLRFISSLRLSWNKALDVCKLFFVSRHFAASCELMAASLKLSSAVSLKPPSFFPIGQTPKN